MNTHMIEVDEDVFAAIQDLSNPRIDTPNSVLRKVLLEGRTNLRDTSTTLNIGMSDLREAHSLETRPTSEVNESRWYSRASMSRANEPEVHATGAPAFSAGEEPGPYSSLGDERRAAGGMSPRRFGKLLCAREFPGETFARARRDRGAFRTMFESGERVLYFLNFNKPGATNLWYKVNATALQALLAAEKPACVVFTNPAERVAWVIPVTELASAYRRLGDRTLGDRDLDMNFDVVGDRVRELDWGVGEYRREV